MRAAFVLHLYYPDVALELIERVAALGNALDIIVTAPGPLAAPVQAALDALPNDVTVVRTPNRGWDIGPLFAILPLLAERGYDVVCKLHTKRGGSGYVVEWRDLFHEALIGSDALVDRILASFEAEPQLDMLGPAALYKSAAAHMFQNSERLGELAPLLTAPAFPPSDWGFFAGTMFWARRSLLERLAPLARFEAGETGDEGRDGALAHASERLFGLAPFAHGGTIGLVGPASEGAPITLIEAPGAPSYEPIVNTLVARAEESAGSVTPALAELIQRENPLIDYIRHGRDADALDPNPYFSSTWYNSVNADVFAAGMHPLEHYMHHGAFEDRSTSALFDMGFYVANNPEVAERRLDPLRHFLEHGLPAGQVAIPVGGRPEEEDGPRRFYRSFDLGRERSFLQGLATLSEAQKAAARAVRFSVVMPAYNRQDSIAAAIRSVLAQTHKAFELIVVDDGSTDDTVAVVSGFLADPRVRLVHAAHGGVSAARNAGLAQATGDMIAYLDSDNRWKAWFLEVMALFMASEGLEAACCAIELRDDLGQLAGYRGADFDWDACVEQNYIDLNAFVHARALVPALGGFDTGLRRMVDWDLILRYGRDRRVGYAPFVGCEYFDGRADTRRITVSEPAAFQKLVRAKNRLGLAGARLAAEVKLSFAIKCAAPEAEKVVWGDYHFAESLKEALERLGHVAHIDFRDHWHVRPVAQEDVAIVLRGLIPYEPQVGQISFLWNISHPDQVDYGEYDRFTRVYVASASYAALLGHIVRPPVSVLLQATDTTRFYLAAEVRHGPDILFCGNSRGVQREIVSWAFAAGLTPVIYGGGWEGRVPSGTVRAETIDNRALGPLYASAAVVLNDHWPSMRTFGFLSNRLFDIVASGGRAISDPVPSMSQVFAGVVAEVSGPASFRAATIRLSVEPRSEAQAAAARNIGAVHSFDQRALRIVEDAYGVLGLPSPHAAAAAQPALPVPPLRVHIVAPFGPYGPQSSAFIRLLAPLTDETVSGRCRVSLASAHEPIPDCDVCIVQRAALPSIEHLQQLVRQLGSQGAALVTDVDDAFTLIGPEHPEQAQYSPLNAALDGAIAASAETWFSTPALAEIYADRAHRHAIVPNALDPRIWRDFRHPPQPASGRPVRFLYMGTHTHGADFALVRPALERLAEERPGAFDVTVIGVAPDLAPAPWLVRLSPPADAIVYPRFVRWLRRQGPFQVGLAPLVETAFNRAKSDIKLLDYAALGLVPIVSEGATYRGDARAAELILFAEPSTESWLSILRGVVDDPAACAVRAEALHAHLWTSRSISSQSEAMVARLEALAAAKGRRIR